jgi:hypothetical protein
MAGDHTMPWYGSHTYLNEYIRQNNCRKILEIGVYTGENAVSMVETALECIGKIRGYPGRAKRGGQ